MSLLQNLNPNLNLRMRMRMRMIFLYNESCHKLMKRLDCKSKSFRTCCVSHSHHWISDILICHQNHENVATFTQDVLANNILHDQLTNYMWNSHLMKA